MKTLTALLLIFFCTIYKMYSQQSNTLFLMNKSVESNIINPSKRLDCYYFIGFPALSSIHFDLGSTGFSYRTAVAANGELQLDKIVDNTFWRSSISANFHLQLLSFGYKLNKKNDVFFSISDKAYVNFTYPKSFIKLGAYGNKQFVDETVSLKGLSLQGAYYREFSFGLARTINKKTDVGIKLKLLFGKTSVKSRIRELSLFTDPVSYAITTKSEFDLFTSFPLTVSTDAKGKLSDINTKNIDVYKFIMNGSNIGLAIDLGGTYNVNKKITFIASLIDFGFIRWKTDANQFSQKSDFQYNSQSYATGTSLLDSLQTMLELTPNENAFTTWLPSHTNFAIEYKYNDKVSFSAINRNQILYNTFIPSFTIGVSYSPNYKLQSILTWSYINNTLLNLGIGFSYQLGVTRFHFVTDNILPVFWPESARGTSVRLGLNFMFGCPRIKTKKERCDCELNVYQDKRR